MVFLESAIRTMEGFSSAIRKAIRTPLLWLAILYLCVGLAYALVTPLFEKPDEDGHYGYILYLRENYKLPPLIFSEGFPSEYKQPPLYYVVTSTLTGWLPGPADPDQLLATNPYMDFSVPGYRNDNRNVFLHPPYLTPLVLGARLVSLLFGLGTMLSSYYLALKLFHKDSLIPMATAAVVGFQPQFLYIATAVNNDAAMAFFATLVLTILVYRLERDDVPHFAILMGAILGLASITKVSGLVLFPLTSLALLIIHRGLSRALFRDGVVIVTVALLIGGWWYVRNGLLYGDPLSIGVHTSGDTPVRLFGSRIRHDLLSIEHTFWANLSRTFVGQIWLEKALVWWGRVSLGLLAVGLVLNWLNLPPWALDSRLQRSPWGFHTWFMLLSWPLTFLLLLITYWTQEGSWAYGRLLFPAVAPIALCLVLGWVCVFPPDWRRLSLTFGVGVVMIISSLLPALSICPMYHPWRKPDSEDLGQPVGTIYSDPDAGARVARLISYNLPEPYVSPGAYLPVELCWEPLGRTEVPYAVLVQLLDLSQLDAYGSPGVWGGRRTYPGLGNLPTDRWRLGEPFCDTILVHVSPVAPTPLGATIEIGFIEPETGKRLQASGPEGSPADMSVLRGIPILDAGDLPTSERESTYVIDQAIGLNRVIVSTPAPDDMTVTLVWQSLQPVTYDATVFVHLLEANGDLLAQVDRQPLDGQFPTSYWLPDQVITDTIRLSPLNDHYDTSTTLTVGMYTWPSLDRLPVLDSPGTLQPDNVIAIDIPSPLPGEKVVVP
jgi:4-amino-4-deoxy-L-arabinose transferase-like glycosyltransferase